MADDSGFEKIQEGSDAGFEKHEPRTAGKGVAEGMQDLGEGGGQLLYNVLPKPVNRALTAANNAVAPYSGGLIRELPSVDEGGKNTQIKQRETAIEKERGPNAGMDWPRLAGNILNPVNYIGGAFGGAKAGATAAERIALGMESAEIGGAVAGTMQPATSDNYWGEKALQAGVGAVAGGVLGGAFAGGSEVIRSLGETVARHWPENLTSAAVEKILKRIKADEAAGGPTAAQAIDLVNTAKKPVTLADVGEENIKAQAGSVLRAPGEGRAAGRKFLRERDEKASQRLDADIAQHLHSGQTAFQASRALIDARSAASKPVYQEAHALENIWSPRLQEFLGSPDLKKGLARGYEIERNHALAEGRPITATQLGVDLDTEGNIKMVKAPNMLLLDMAKQGLDAMIADERNDITGRLSKYGISLDAVRRAFVTEMDALDKTGAYKKARDTWGGYSASMDAVKLGQSVFTAHPEEFAAEIKNMSPSNLEFVRMGVADRLREKLLKTGLSGDEGKALIKNDWVRKQLRPAFKSDEDFNAFADAVSQETQMFETSRKLVGGPQTAERVAEDSGGPENPYAAAMQKALMGQPVSAISDAYKIWRQIGFKPDPKLNAKIAEILFSTKIEPDIADLLRRGGRPIMNPGAEKAASAVGAVGQAAAPVASADINKAVPLQ